MNKLVYFYFVFIVVACSKDNDKNDAVCYSNSNTESMVHDGEDREYLMYVPVSYDGTTSVPILFNFHGFGGSVEEFMEYADLRSVAETNTFILVSSLSSLYLLPSLNAALLARYSLAAEGSIKKSTPAVRPTFCFVGIPGRI